MFKIIRWIKELLKKKKDDKGKELCGVNRMPFLEWRGHRYRFFRTFTQNGIEFMHFRRLVRAYGPFGVVVTRTRENNIILPSDTLEYDEDTHTYYFEPSGNGIINVFE